MGSRANKIPFKPLSSLIALVLSFRVFRALLISQSHVDRVLAVISTKVIILAAMPENSDVQKGSVKKTHNKRIEYQIQHTLPREPLPFIHWEIEISYERTSEYVIAAIAALIEPIHLSSGVVSAAHLSFALLQLMIIREGWDFVDVGKTFEIWDPAGNTSIEGEFQLRNAIGLQWVKMIHVEDQSTFKLVVCSKDRNEEHVLN